MALARVMQWNTDLPRRRMLRLSALGLFGIPPKAAPRGSTPCALRHE
jgi:hypothetical protein